VESLENSFLSALKSAFYENAWTKDQIESMSSSDWELPNGFVPGTLDLAMLFLNNANDTTPFLSSIQIDHEGYSTGTKIITFTSVSDLFIENLKDAIAWWKQDGSDLKRGHFEGETKGLSGSAINRGSNLVSLICDAYDLKEGHLVTVRKTTNYNETYVLYSPYVDVIGDLGEVIFFSPSPNLNALKLCKVKLTSTVEPSLVEMPAYVYELYDQSSRYLKTTYNLGRISYYLETIDGKKWIPGTKEALVFDENTVGSHLMVDQQPVLIEVKAEMGDVSVTSTSTTTTASTTTETTTTSLTTYDPLVVRLDWSPVNIVTWPQLGAGTSVPFRSAGCGYDPVSQRMYFLPNSINDGTCIIGSFSVPVDAGSQGWFTPVWNTEYFYLSSYPYNYINQSGYDPITNTAILVYSASNSFWLYRKSPISGSSGFVRISGIYDSTLGNSGWACHTMGNGKAYFFTRGFTTVYAFDLATSVWSSHATSGWTPAALYYAEPVYHPGTNSVYVIGGLQGSHALKTIWKLNMSTYVWTNVGELMSPTYNVIFYPYGNYLLGKGGMVYGSGSTYPQTYRGSLSLIIDVSTDPVGIIPSYTTFGSASDLGGTWFAESLFGWMFIGTPDTANRLRNLSRTGSYRSLL
jgi:hypothetical protein